MSMNARLTSPNRSAAHTWAAILNLVVAIFSIVISLPILPAGATETAASGDQPPFAIIILSLVLGVLAVVSTYGVWVGQRWGVIMTIVLNGLSLLSGVPGVLFGPTTFLVVSSVLGCILNVVIIYLLLRRERGVLPAGASVEPTSGARS